MRAALVSKRAAAAMALSLWQQLKCAAAATSRIYFAYKFYRTPTKQRLKVQFMKRHAHIYTHLHFCTCHIYNICIHVSINGEAAALVNLSSATALHVISCISLHLLACVYVCRMCRCIDISTYVFVFLFACSKLCAHL